jgi:hypothetical protein
VDAPDRSKPITVGLTKQQIDGLLGYLLERPCKEVYGLVSMLLERQQALVNMVQAAEALAELDRARPAVEVSDSGNGADPDPPGDSEIGSTDPRPSH